MKLRDELQQLIVFALEDSYNHQNYRSSQYDVAINIARYHTECELPLDLQPFVDGAINLQKWEFGPDIDMAPETKRMSIKEPQYTSKMAEWAINEAKERSFLRIVDKFHLMPNDPKTEEIERYLNVLYNPASDENDREQYSEAMLGLKGFLIKARLEHRNKETYNKNSVLYDQDIESYIKGETTLEVTKKSLTDKGLNANGLDAILTKFCILRTIDTAEKVHDKVLNEAAAIFHQVFAKEAEILGGLQSIKFAGDEILYRGIDTTSGQITEEQIKMRFNEVHRSG